MTPRLSMGCLLLFLAVPLGCDGGDYESEDGDDGIEPSTTFTVSGTILDLETGQPVDGSATVSVDGIVAPVTTTGAEFTIEAPANSTFHVMAASPPNYRATYNAAVEVGESDIEGLELYTVSETFLSERAQAFAVEPSSGAGILLLAVVGDDGNPLEGVPADAFRLPDGAIGPYFLDAELAAAPELEATSASGLVMIFDVAPGVTTITADEISGYALAAPDSPVAGTAVTYVQAVAAQGEEIDLPVDVSFAEDVTPILLERGCVNCHDGGGVGKDQGGVHFNGESEKMYRELAVEISDKYGETRVNVEQPEASLLLNLPRCQAPTCPRAEEDPLAHPFSTFTGPSDPGYLTILVWIQEGALNN